MVNILQVKQISGIVIVKLRTIGIDLVHYNDSFYLVMICTHVSVWVAIKLSKDHTLIFVLEVFACYQRNLFPWTYQGERFAGE